jgi:hypothetical protein
VRKTRFVDWPSVGVLSALSFHREVFLSSCMYVAEAFPTDVNTENVES